MNFPKKNLKGCTIGLVSPSSPISQENILKCKEFLQKQGYNTKDGKSIYLNYNGYLSGNDIIRAEDINSMFLDDDVDAIFCIRGGYGCSRILKYIDFNIPKYNPKIFVGYSDITSLHICLNQLSNLVTFHGPMVYSNMLSNYDEFTKNSFEYSVSIDKILPLINPSLERFKKIVDGKAAGQIVGGNLSIVVSTLGTEYEIDTKCKILFLEDIDESVPKIDRMLQQLIYSNKIQDCNGIILGDFANCENKYEENYTVERLLIDTFSDLNKPVMYNIKSGHCFPMATIPLGAYCVMDTYRNIINFI